MSREEFDRMFAVCALIVIAVATFMNAISSWAISDSLKALAGR